MELSAIFHETFLAKCDGNLNLFNQILKIKVHQFQVNGINYCGNGIIE